MGSARWWMGSGLAMAMVLATACAEDDPPSDQDGGGALADAAPAGSPDAAARDAGSPDAAALDAAPDAMPGGMIIDAVILDGGFTQVHPGIMIELVILGSGLGGVTDVTFEGGSILFPEDLTVTPTQVRAVMWLSGGQPPGPRDVTASGTDGSVTAPGAFEVTPWVFAAGAAPGGRGTHESPLLLREYVEGAGRGDTLLFLAGEHSGQGALLVGEGATIAGEGAATTVLRGVSGSFGGLQFYRDSPTTTGTTVRDLTLITSNGSSSVYWQGSAGLTVRDVVIEGDGIDAWTPQEGMFPFITLERVSYDGRGGPGNGLSVHGAATVSVSDSSFAGCQVGIAVEAGMASITGVAIDLCARAIWVRGAPDDFGGFHPLQADISAAQLRDNAEGIDVATGVVDISDTVIEDLEATAAAGARGIVVRGGSVSVTATDVRGQDETGIDMDVWPGSSSDLPAALYLSEVLVEGGQVGVRAQGYPDDNGLRMRDSVVAGQTVAAVQIEQDNSFFDLGDSADGDGNQLSVVSGFALVDLRTDPLFWPTIEATGTTLNGNAYAGQLIQGPTVLAPDYSIVADGSIQF